MSVRFRRSVKIAPGIRINFNTHSTSLTLGPRGAHYTMSSTGRRTISSGIPGTGLYASESYNPRTQAARASREERQLSQQPEDLTSFPGPTPRPNFFSSGAEKDFSKMLIEFYSGDQQPSPKEIVEKTKALEALHPKLNIPLEIITFIHILNEEEYADHLLELGARIWLRRDEYFSNSIVTKYFRGIRPVIQVTPGIHATEILNTQQFGFMWVEVLQAHDKLDQAMEVLHEMNATQLVGISIADIELSQKDYDAVLETTADITNEDDATLIMLVIRGIAFREQSLYDASLECFKQALAKKNRQQEALNRVHLERSITYEKMGKIDAARKDLELILANDAKNEEAKERLGKLKDVN